MSLGLARSGVMLAALVGLLSGVGGFTFHYAEGLSYMSDDPKVCANCHIMNEQFDSYLKGPHRAVAGCTDCHLPADFLGKYVAKARNGYHHSMGFTFQSSTPDAPGARRVFEEPIRIKPTNSQILQDNCLLCHGDLVDHIVHGSTYDKDAARCVKCHRSVGHGATR